MTSEKTTRKGKAPEAPAAPSSVFLHTQVIQLPAELPGPDHGAVLATIQAGYRPAGPAYVERQEDAGPSSVAVTWAVPIEAA